MIETKIIVIETYRMSDVSLWTVEPSSIQCEVHNERKLIL